MRAYFHCGSSSKTATPAVSAAPSGTTAPAATAAPAAVDCKAAGAICIGLVTDLGHVDDKSFNQSAWEGAQQAAKETGGKAEFIETSAAKDYAANLKKMIDNGNTIILSVGFALGDETAKAAAANPKLHFIGVDQFQAKTIDNYTGLIWNEDKAGFMAGALAGLLTKTNKIGAVLGLESVPPVVAYAKGWELGAKYTNPKVESKLVYHAAGDNAFNDPAWGATTAKQELDGGADVIFGAGGNTGNGALKEVAKAAGAFCVGVDTDQWDTVPEAHPCLVTSAEKLIAPGVVDIVKTIKAGTVKGGNFSGKTGIAAFHDFDSKIPADVKAKVAQIVADIQSGKLGTGFKAG